MKKENPIREKNKHLLLSLISDYKTFFAADLVKTSSLSLVTVNTILKELLTEKIIFEDKMIQQAMGRPAMAYRFNSDFSHVLFLHFSETKPGLKLHGRVFNLSRELLFKTNSDFSQPTPLLFIKFVKSILSEQPLIKQISFSFPGKIYNGHVQSSWQNLFNNWSFPHIFSTISELPYTIENDAHLITLGQAKLAHIPLNKTIVGIFYPSHSMPGITIWSAGQLIQGHNHLAGEAKYFPFLQNKKKPTSYNDWFDNIKELAALYNVALAPDYFIISSDDPSFYARLNQESFDCFLHQPNQPNIILVKDIAQATEQGLFWLTYHQTPFTI